MSQDQISFLDLQTPNRQLAAEFQAVFADIVQKAAFIGGPIVEKFENDFAEWIGGGVRAVAVSNGTSALKFALQALGVKPGDICVTVPNTFIATTEAITQAYGKIDFVDVDPKTSLMDPKKLEEYLVKAKAAGKLPKVVIPVHLYGQCVDMDPIMALAKTYGFKVLEDAAQAHGANYKGKPAGSIGDMAAFSFYPGKNLGALGEAGGVTSKDEKLLQTVKTLRDHGQTKKYYHDLEGDNGRLDTIQCACLSIKLKHLRGWNAKRVENAQRYYEKLTNIKGLTPVQQRGDGQSCYHLFVVHTPRRDDLHNFLKEKGIHTAFHYPQPLHLQKCYTHLGYKEGAFPVAEKLCRELISLPMYAELTRDQVDRVVAACAEFF